MLRVCTVTHSVCPRRAWLFAGAVLGALAVGCGHLGSAVSSPGAVHAASLSRLRPHDGVPARVLTWTNADRVNPAIDWSVAARYVDLAMVGQSASDRQLAATVSGAGIGVVEYTNPNRQAQAGAPHFPNNLQSDYAHDCRGNRIYRTGYGQYTPPPGPTPTPTDRATYLMDPHSPNLAVSWTNEVTNFWSQSGVTPAYVFEDTADSIEHMSGRPCHYRQPDWTDATNALDLAMTAATRAAGESVSIIYNGLGVPLHPSPTRTPPAIGLNVTVAGGMAEDCYSRQPAPSQSRPDPEPQPEHESQWLDMEYLELTMAAAHKLFVCNAASDQVVDAEHQTGLRLFVVASFLMTYDPATSVLDERFQPVSGFAVFPESEIVALNPLFSSPSQMSDLAVGGVYARQYAACYVDGAPIGQCAVIVNPSVTATGAYPFPDVYAGSIKLVGGGVLDAGAKVKLLAKIPGTVGPRSAVIVYGTASPPAPSPTPTPVPSPSPSDSPSPSPSPSPSSDPSPSPTP